MKSTIGNLQKNYPGEIQSATSFNQSRKKKNTPQIDITKKQVSDDFCDFNEEDDSVEENLVMIQEEEKNVYFEEDIKQIEEDLRLAGYCENIELFDVNKLKGKIVTISKTNHGSRFKKIYNY